MIPLTKKEFKVFLIVLELLLFVVLLVGFIFYTNHRREQIVTPEMEKELDEWTRVARATRRLVKDDALWQASLPEAPLIAESIAEDMDLSIYATYRTDDDELIEGFIFGGNVPNIKNQTVKETTKLKLTHCLASSTIAAALRKNNRSVALVSVTMSWQDANGAKYELIDADADGTWDNQPSE